MEAGNEQMIHESLNESSNARSGGFIYRFIPAHDAAKSVETFLLLHGTGGDENDLLSLGQTLAGGRRDVALLSPRGQVLESGMPSFFRRLAEGVFDEPDLVRRAHELAAFIAQAVQQYTLDQHRITASGSRTAPTSPPASCCYVPVCSATPCSFTR
jgi:predicted esterase